MLSYDSFRSESVAAIDKEMFDVNNRDSLVKVSSYTLFVIKVIA